jgi:D-alanyl-D-alanine carboxypeptidase/D-alanyl-D-alanine-endopeptidase (penicillin-binding protein 4)
MKRDVESMRTVLVLLLVAAVAVAARVMSRTAAPHTPAAAQQAQAQVRADSVETDVADAPVAAASAITRTAPAGPSAAAAARDPRVAALQAELAGVLQRPGWSGDHWGVAVVSLDRGDTLFIQGADRPLTPASNMKLFSSAAGLQFLGPDFRFTTFLMGTGPVEAGVLEGDLVLYGTGDPTLSSRYGNLTAVWSAFADSLRTMGITGVRGDLVGDASYFTGSGAGQGWKETYLNASYAAPASALSYAENLVTLEIRPGPAAGAPPEVRSIPGGANTVDVLVDATTVAGGRTSVSARRESYGGGIVVRGQIAHGAAPVRRVVPLGDPEAYAAAALREALDSAGITVAGRVRTVLDPETSPVTGRSVFAPAFGDSIPLRVLAIHDSPPLLDILEVVNKRSHNLMAEQVLRAVGRVVVGEGSVPAGARAVAALMEEAGSNPDLAIMDGSGLSALNRVSARDLIHLLSFMRHSPMWEAYWHTLPEAGGPGGLRRMSGTAAQGNLRAKTGTIDSVSALSGYVRAANGELLAFAIMANAVPSTWRAKRVEDEIGASLAAFDRGQPPMDTPTPERTDTTPDTIPATAEVMDTAPRTHTIRAGDTLEGIARQYGTTVPALEAANPQLDPRRLIPGRTLRLPGGSTAPEVAAPPPERSVTPPPPPRTYTVREGDTLGGIARRHGVTLPALEAANPDLDPRRLIPGRTVVRIPGG